MRRIPTRKVTAFVASLALVAGVSVVVADEATASVTTPTAGSTVRGTITVTESPGGSDTSSILGIHHCGGNTSTILQLINSGGAVVWSTSNGGGTLSASLTTEDYANGSYTVRGTENDGANSGFGGFGCKSNTRVYNNAITIANAQSLTYTGDTVGTAYTNATVSAKDVDLSTGSPISGAQITFKIGTSSVTAATNSSGIATASLPLDVSPGNTSINVTTPSTTFFTQASTSSGFTVNKVPLTMSAFLNGTAVYGAPATLGSSATGVITGHAPTGTLQYEIDGNSLGSAVPYGAASPSFSTIDAGSHTAIVAYSGDSFYLPATSADAGFTIAKADTTTAITSSKSPTTFGESVTFTATVSVTPPSTGSPSGAVQFDIDGQPFGTAVALNGNTATLTLSSLTAGNHQVSATYDGDADFNVSSSAEITQGVSRSATTTSVASTNEPSVVGQPVSFTATVAAVSPGTGTPTGQVQFYVDNIALGDPVDLNNGSATSPSIATLGAGPHSVEADYLGTSNYAGSNGLATQDVGRADTTTAVTSEANPSVHGQPVVFDATVSVVAPGAGTPDGQVQFYVDNVAVGTPVTLSNGAASSAPIADLTTGTHTITAKYLGSGSFVDSTSDGLTQTVNRAKTSTTLGSSVNPSVWGQTVTFTATVGAVAPGAGNPTGSITFSDGSTVLATVPVGPDTAEQASYATSSLAVAAHAITASYSGDGDFLGSSDALTQTVLRAQTSTTLVSSVNPSQSGQAVKFTATVSPVAPGAGLPTGTVTFTVNGAQIGGPVALDGNASATSSAFSSLTPGTYSIKATYNGDNHFVTSTGDLDQGAGQTVTQAGTSLALASTPNPANYGATVAFTATVTASAPGNGTPTGVVDFFDGSVLLGAVSLVADQPGTAHATFTSSTLGTGSHAISAKYVGNFNFTGSTNSLAQTIGTVPTVTGLSAAPNPITYGQSTTLTATVAASPASAGDPGGTVTFSEGSTVLGTAPLAAVQGHQQASLVVSGLHAGDHHLTATYSGSTQFAGSTSTPVTVTVNRASANLVARSYITDSQGFPGGGIQIYGRVEATLTGNGGAPLAGETLVFSTTQVHTDGNTIHICDAVTDANGSAQCDATTLFTASTLDGGYDVTFNGNADYAPVTVHQRVDSQGGS